MSQPHVYTQEQLEALSAKIDARLEKDRERSRRSYAKRKTMVVCDVCGSKIANHSMRLHVKSRKHIAAMSE